MENDLKFSGQSPVTIDYNGSAEDIYAPVRTSSLDVNIVSEHILDDLYTARKNEICVKVERKVPEYITVTTVTDIGSVNSQSISPVPTADENYTIYQKDLFFTDINGDFRFKGILLDSYNHQWMVNLKYNYTTHVWEENNYWNLTVSDSSQQYFYYGTNSFLVEYDGTSHYISTWSGSGWTNKRAYNKIEGSTLSDMAYGVKQIIHFIDGTMELVFGKNRYGWDDNWKRWFKKTDYTAESDYTGTYGEWYHRIKNSSGVLIDAIVVNGLGGEDWICAINHTYNELTKLIPLQSSYDLDNIFTDDAGNVYCIKNAGDIYVWSWASESWIKWVSFSGDFVAGSFYIDYVITGTRSGNSGRYKRVVIKYTNSTTNKNEAFMLYSFNPPTVQYSREPTGNYTTETIWEGYKMPNTYSQDVTLNLDTINMTCIDPVSILKYVTIDKILNKPGIVSYGELIGLSLAYVMLHSNKLMIERTVLYSTDSYAGDNTLIDLRCQVSNFWDESDKPSNLYDMIQELLKPFCLTLVYANDTYWIYNNNKTEGTRTFDRYTIDADGTLTRSSEESVDTEVFDLDEGDWISNNTSEATLEINNTYEKVTGIANTSVPSYSKMAIDTIDISQTDKYNSGGGNVQVNKTKGYKKQTIIITIRPGQSHPRTIISKDTDDHWFYLWNGVYADPDYELVPWTYNQGDYVEWYRNVNKLYEYIYGTTTAYGADHGQLITFYGGANNPTGTGKQQTPEKSVEVSKRITAYAADNGVPPEFLETSDLAWTYSRNGGTPLLTKVNDTDSRFGSGIVMQSLNNTRIVYHQTCENVRLSALEDNIIDLSLSHSFSRTGVDVKLDVMSNNTATNKVYYAADVLQTCDSDFFPSWWNATQVKVDSYYFRRYKAGSGGTSTCRPVWDERMVKMYVKLSDDTYLQFNGKDWVSDDGTHSHPFVLTKMMTGEKLFHNDIQYNAIRCPSDQTTIRYSLTGDDIYIYYDNNGGVVDEETNDYTRCKPYNSEENYWYQWIASCGEGQLSIKLPYVDDPAATVYVDIYSSTMLGMNGSDETVGSVADHTCPFYYTKSGETEESTANFKEVETYFNFLPKNVSHIKAEHLDMKISINVPESNLGQMFSQSDIEYVIDSKSGYVEEYSGPSFQVNTQNPLVASSYSYLLYNYDYADPGEFIINHIGARPEAYTVQAYFNWLSRIRKIYTKTLVPLKDSSRPFNNLMTFINTPEIGDNPMMVISDSWDIKTDRHSITAIEADHLEVDYVSQFLVNELPHKARAERWNLPTVNKS